MRKQILDIIHRLKKEEKFWTVGFIGNFVRLTKMVNGNSVVVTLEHINGKFSIIFPKYRFISKISKFAPAEPEDRCCCNEQVLLSLLRVLKRYEIWNHVDNKSFFGVNKGSGREDKKDLLKQQTEMLL